MSKWTLLLTDENRGLVGKAGFEFRGHPDRYRRVDVIERTTVIDAAQELYEALDHVEKVFSAHERGEELPDDSDAENWAYRARAALSKARGE